MLFIGQGNAQYKKHSRSDGETNFYSPEVELFLLAFLVLCFRISPSFPSNFKLCQGSEVKVKRFLFSASSANCSIHMQHINSVDQAEFDVKKRKWFPFHPEFQFPFPVFQSLLFLHKEILCSNSIVSRAQYFLSPFKISFRKKSETKFNFREMF